MKITEVKVEFKNIVYIIKEKRSDIRNVDGEISSNRLEGYAVERSDE